MKPKKCPSCRSKKITILKTSIVEEPNPFYYTGTIPYLWEYYECKDCGCIHMKKRTKIRMPLLEDIKLDWQKKRRK